MYRAYVIICLFVIIILINESDFRNLKNTIDNSQELITE